MKNEKNILLAFILNLSFSVFELIGGIFTGSVAIISDSLHDLGDAASIGFSFAFEKKSRRRADDKYTYGYGGFSVLGGIITTCILLVGSVIVCIGALIRIIYPAPVNYNGMIIFALMGLLINLAAAYFTREGDSLNERAVNLHMLEDVLGWAVVLVGAVVMRFTDFWMIDPLMSVGVAIFIFVHAVRNLTEAGEILLARVPRDISVPELREHILQIEGVKEVHHIHVWRVDDRNICATLHVVAGTAGANLKESIRGELAEHGIFHSTVEVEGEGEHCNFKVCRLSCAQHVSHAHHAHHH